MLLSAMCHGVLRPGACNGPAGIFEPRLKPGTDRIHFKPLAKWIFSIHRGVLPQCPFFPTCPGPRGWGVPAKMLHMLPEPTEDFFDWCFSNIWTS